ncbi:MAG: hypothetical protein KJ956_07180, partial [Actinobacteria bacterium]|nr:hypothetical protein [Actinomycetota bacterium]
LRHGTIGKWLTESTWYRGDGVSKTHGSESFTIPAPALVDAALFDRASEVYAENRAAHSYGATWTETDNGLKVRGLRYGVAGRILHEHDGTFSPMEGATRKGTRRYACQTNRAAVSGCRGFDVVKGNRTKSLPAAPVEYVALGSLLRVLGDPEELARLTADHEVKNDAATGGATPADLRSRLSDLGGERVRLVSHAARAGLSDEALDEFLAEHDLEVGRVSVALELAEHETRRPKPQTTSSLCSSNGRSGFRLPARSADGPTRPRAMRSAPGSTTSP